MKYSIYNILFLFALTASICSCKKFDELNTDPVKPADTSPEQLLLSAEKSAMDALYNSIVNNRVGMHYAQYWSATDKEEGSRYQLDEGSNSTLWSLYNGPLEDLKEIERLNETSSFPESVPNQNAIAGILQAWIIQTLADTYGNIPYSQAVKPDVLMPPYDDAATIYLDLIKQLNNNQAALDAAAPSYSSGDVLYKGDVTKWKKLANSLIVRIAMRMSEVKPAEAKTAIEMAVKNGVITDNTDEALFPYTGEAPNTYPYNELGRELTEFVVSETLVNYMEGLKDPRLEIYARPATNSKTIIGKPYGLGTNSASDAQKYSTPGVRVYAPDFPGILITSSEVQFLLAEAAARGMNVGGTAEVFYKAGIKANMDFWKVPEAAATTYINSVPYKSSGWKNVIGTQKWIAMYMQGLQSWYERLRLQFTKPDGTPLFIAPVAGSLDPNVTMVPNRLTYPVVETNTNARNKDAAAAAIGGDTKGTKLWWQKF
ncbi:SusD/RagB family nutrient-binding outer membrane lipoprotein [Niabella beijingensis]|uniref:SusD/RagB family nutrient-binding outer membrane lipoprotein n=1 Tax=Niabella beijingensis TaxID=2872700 RepID=UPI001CBC56C7|nr:SusD/RagB family nutrient-binding outer membrane lipoprotein [Niabella beijingensis]MBZ4187556.1 SusD/RagB family nutrient-binding outer membrane lipoprotein [Niabella beijingensis]